MHPQKENVECKHKLRFIMTCITGTTLQMLKAQMQHKQQVKEVQQLAAQHIQETFDSCSHPGDKYSHQNKHSSETNEHHVLMHCIYMMQFKFLVCLSSEFSSSELPSNTKLEFQACTSLMVPFWCQLIAQSSHSANSNTSPCVTPTLATARQG